eukprot:scaffold21598_cov107-Isochrysis_galbana.AAC.2
MEMQSRCRDAAPPAPHLRTAFLAAHPSTPHPAAHTHPPHPLPREQLTTPALPLPSTPRLRPPLFLLLGHPGCGLKRVAALRGLHPAPAALHPAGGSARRPALLLGPDRPDSHPLPAHLAPAVGQAAAVPPLLLRPVGVSRGVGRLGLLADGHHPLGQSRPALGHAVALRRLLARAVLCAAARRLLALVALQEQPAVRLHGRGGAGGRAAGGGP